MRCKTNWPRRNRGLVALSMELEQRVEERTAELAAKTAKLAQEIVDREHAQREVERYRDRYVDLYDSRRWGTSPWRRMDTFRRSILPAL